MILNYLEKRKKLLVYIPLAIYWLILLTATSLPSQKMPDISYNDKTMHFIAFAGLGFLLTLAFMMQRRFRELRGYAILAAVTVGALYAALDEFHQKFIPGRSAEMLDWVADFIGCIIGAILCLIVTRFPLQVKERKGIT